MSKFLKYSCLSVLLIAALSLSSCSDDDDPTPSMGIVFENVTANSVDIKWDAVEGAIAYDVEYVEVNGDVDDCFRSLTFFSRFSG